MEEKILNEEQKQAINHIEGPLLVIAGAGTGKTTVITERIKYLILEKGVSPQNILALTFTEKAAREMEERVDIAVPYGFIQMWISTFHAFCDRILRSEAVHIGLNPAYKLMTESEALAFLKSHIFDLDLEYFRPLSNPNKFLEALLAHFSRLADEDISPDEYIRYAENLAKNKKYPEDEIKKIKELSNAYKTYTMLKVKEGVMDFSDLISTTLLLFRTRKNVLKAYQNQFQYILVDEFQDTNYAQNELAILLSGETENITVVADDDQSIYRWRGAAISNVIQFKKNFPQAKIITLTKNYRSTQAILDSAYRLIQNNNPDRLEIKENINKKLISTRSLKGEAPHFIFIERLEDEAEAVVSKIKELSRKYEWRDFAILVRANDHSRPFTQALERRGIPYQFLGPGQLFHQEEIKDLIAYLNVLYNFEDSASLFRVLCMPIFNLQTIEIVALVNLARRKNYSLFNAMEDVNELLLKEETKEKIKTILAMIKRHIERINKDTAGQILYYFLHDAGLLKILGESKNELEERRAKNVAKFFDRLKTYEAEHKDASVFAIVDWIEIAQELGESPLASDIDWTENNAVNILTVHSSKGLEFPVVFLVNLVSDRFPTRERKEAIPIPNDLVKEVLPTGDYHLQEERRLFYVGLTRARDLVLLTASKFYGEGKRERKISPFVYETLGKEAVEKAQKKENSQKSAKQLLLLDYNLSPQEQKSKQNNSSFSLSYISYSQIQTFDICPLHYKLKYILKIPTPPSASQSFGTSIHSTLRDFYKSWISGIKIDIKEAEILLERNWIGEGYQSKTHEEDAKKKAKRLIREYLKNNFDEKNLPLAVELPFQFNLMDLRVGGRIDRIDAKEKGKIEIIDYKTGEKVPKEKELLGDLQLTFYALAATQIKEKPFGKDFDEVLLSLYFLDQGVKLTATRTKKQLEDAKELILRKRNEILNSSFSCSKSALCRTCEYKMFCSVE